MLLSAGNRVFIAAASRGFYSSESPAKFLEHTETHLRGILAHMGVKDVTVFRAEGIGLGSDARKHTIDTALGAIDKFHSVKLAA